jgi:hypothetical protein
MIMIRFLLRRNPSRSVACYPMCGACVDYLSTKARQNLERHVTKGTERDPINIPGPPEIQAHPGLSPTSPTREEKTAEELAEMIRNDLSMIEGCPARGIKVTVYGLNPWNSLLTFGVEAGPVPNKTDLQAFCDVITKRLKRLYSIKA